MNIVKFKKLSKHLMENILPTYEKLDRAHNAKHIENTMAYGVEICKAIGYENVGVIITALAYHDIGMLYGERKNHHIVSAGIVFSDLKLREIFTKEEIALIYKAVIEHRTSIEKTTLESKIVSDADKLDSLSGVDRMFDRSVKYSYDNKKGEVDEEELFQEVYIHLKEKFGDMGEVQFNIPEVGEMYKDIKKEIESVLNDEEKSREKFSDVYKRLINGK